MKRTPAKRVKMTPAGAVPAHRELTTAGKAALDKVADAHGMISLVALHRLCEWFALQPEDVQNAILQRSDDERENAKLNEKIIRLKVGQ